MMQFTMRYSNIALLVMYVTAQSNLPTLPEAVQDLPSCSYDAFADAMNQYGCSTSSINAGTFNCLCVQNLESIVTAVATNTDYACLDFSDNYGTMCGIYESDPPASDVDAAVTALQNEVGGRTVSSTTSASSSTKTSTLTGAGTSTKTSGATSTPAAIASSSAAGNTVSTTSSEALAAAPTIVQIGGVLAPAFAAVAMLL